MASPVVPEGRAPDVPTRQPVPAVMRFFLEHHDVVKDYVTVVAIVAGGVWAYFLFVSLHQVDKAQAELAALRQYPIANIDLTVTAIPARRPLTASMLVTATVENAGRKTVVMNFADTGAVSIARVKGYDGSHIAFDGPRSVPLYSVTADHDDVMPLLRARLLPGEKSTYQFLLPGVPSGTYLVQFAVPVRTDSAADNGDWNWTARRWYFSTAGPSSAPSRRPGLAASCAATRPRSPSVC